MVIAKGKFGTGISPSSLMKVIGHRKKRMFLMFTGADEEYTPRQLTLFSQSELQERVLVPLEEQYSSETY